MISLSFHAQWHTYSYKMKSNSVYNLHVMYVTVTLTLSITRIILFFLCTITRIIRSGYFTGTARRLAPLLKRIKNNHSSTQLCHQHHINILTFHPSDFICIRQPNFTIVYKIRSFCQIYKSIIIHVTEL